MPQPMGVTAVRMPLEHIKILREIAEKEGMTISRYIAGLLSKEVAKQRKKQREEIDYYADLFEYLEMRGLIAPKRLSATDVLKIYHKATDRSLFRQRFEDVEAVISQALIAQREPAVEENVTK